MPYCPKCREEFQDWVMKCLDCGVPLVDILPDIPVSEPEPPPKSKEEPIKEPLGYVATAPNESLATMWAGILEDEGVVASQAKEAKKILEPLVRDSESTT
jgi:hypothetical protein